jgi:type II secretory ATPase GspE/PulE/Tfp pilus assembly ATPase PilB-like protein
MTELLAEMPPLGDYFSLLKVIVVLALVAPWLYFAPWVSKDAARVRFRRGLWSSLALGSGAIGVFLWLVIPYFLLGLCLYLLCTAALFTVYVLLRNRRVKPEHKVLTREHLAAFFARKEAEKVEVVRRIKVYDTYGKNIIPPDVTTDDPALVEAYNLAQDFLYVLLWKRASEVDLSPDGTKTRVRYVIDGAVSEQPSVPLSESEAIIQYVKPLAGLNAEDRRRPQSGKIAADIAGEPVDLNIMTAGTTGGQRMQIRVVQEAVRTQLDSLGMSPDVLARLREVNKPGGGIVLVSGRSGSGVTSTLYSLLREHDAFTRQLVTLEAKPLIDLENVTQTAYGDPAALPEELASVLRRDPDVIMVDVCADRGTVAAILEAAGGKTFLVGLPAGDSFTALAKWIEACGGAARAAAAVQNLRGVLCQMLMRKLCTKCKQGYPPDPKLLAKINLASQHIGKLYKPRTTPLVDEKGNPYVCPACQGSGYLGRTGVFEFLDVSEEIRQLIAAGGSVSHLKAACRKNKMLYLQEQALREVAEGITSVQEVIRMSEKK